MEIQIIRNPENEKGLYVGLPIAELENRVDFKRCLHDEQYLNVEVLDICMRIVEEETGFRYVDSRIFGLLNGCVVVETIPTHPADNVVEVLGETGKGLQVLDDLLRRLEGELL